MLGGCCDLASLILLRSANFQSSLNKLSLKRKIKSLLNEPVGALFMAIECDATGILACLQLGFKLFIGI
jgi:hypothetical protein